MKQEMIEMINRIKSEFLEQKLKQATFIKFDQEKDDYVGLSSHWTWEDRKTIFPSDNPH